MVQVEQDPASHMVRIAEQLTDAAAVVLPDEMPLYPPDRADAPAQPASRFRLTGWGPERP